MQGNSGFTRSPSSKEEVEINNYIPDTVGAYPQFKESVVIDYKEHSAYMLTFDDYKKLPNGTVLYRPVTGEKIIKTQNLFVANLNGVTQYAFLESQIPIYRHKTEHGGYKALKNIIGENGVLNYIPDTVRAIPQFKINLWIHGESLPGFIVSYGDYKNIPNGTVLYRHPSGEKVIKTPELYAVNLAGETPFAFLESQIPTYREKTEQGGYLPLKSIVGENGVVHYIPDNVGAYQQFKETVILDNLEHPAYRVTYDDYKRLPNGTALYSPVTGTKVIKTPHLYVANLSGVTQYAILESQIPSYRPKTEFGTYKPYIKVDENAIGLSPDSSCSGLLKDFLD